MNHTSAHDFSRGFNYGNRKPTDYHEEGMYVREALKQRSHCGDCEYTDFPYNETYPQVKARIEKDKDNLMAKASPFKIINNFRSYSDNEVKKALLNQGAVVISIPIYDTFAAECPLPTKEAVYKGGHAMCVVGWDETGWIIQNSWSKNWGNKGTLHLPYDYPITEFWGITVDPTLPEPEKENWLSRLLEGISRLFKMIFGKK